MSPQWTSALGTLFVILAAVQIWLMLEVVGREKPRFNERTLAILHRINGYLFLTIYVIFLVVMIRKVASVNAPLDTKSIIHMTLAISILPILLVKILIVRFYPKLFETVAPLLGIGIFTLTVSFVFITAGYYFIKSTTAKYVSAFDPKASHLDVDVGRELVIQKCNKCHDLTRVFTMVKTSDDWLNTVNRMAQRDPTWISPNQIDQIVYFLSERQNINKPQNILTVHIETLLDTRCSKCHNIERIFAKRRTAQEWRTLVTRMSNRHRSWINDTEAKLIGDYLAKIYGIKEETQIKKAAFVTPAVKRKINFMPLFKSYGCIFCHGEEGYGEAPGTPDWTDPEWQESRTDEELVNSITHGVEDRMPTFKDKLTKDEITAAVKFVRSFKGKD
jgi:cytochrome c5